MRGFSRLLFVCLRVPIYKNSYQYAIGGTEKEIVKLKHRDPMVRREASQVLSLIGTVKAFRGLVMASRDPDRKVADKCRKSPGKARNCRRENNTEEPGRRSRWKNSKVHPLGTGTIEGQGACLGHDTLALTSTLIIKLYKDD